jgi:hypothetical protein
MSLIWRPNIPESNDGEPLAKTVDDLFWNFPYHRLPTSPWIISWTMRPELVLILVVIYLNSKQPLKVLIQFMQFNSNSSLFRGWIAVHNALLALYSGITVFYTWPIVIEHLLEHGLYNTYCDPEKTLWHSGFGAWALIFYVSKYYEFLDTWILVLKVRAADPSRDCTALSYKVRDFVSNLFVFKEKRTILPTGLSSYWHRGHYVGGSCKSIGMAHIRCPVE